MQLCTIGFTKKSAEQFFTLLRTHGVGLLVDIRLHPQGQLAGFAKQSDLPYFLKHLADCDYRHMLELAPTEDLLATYHQAHDWAAYARGFLALLDERHIPVALPHDLFTSQVCCLLCSESTPEHCHRRLVAERLVATWPELEIVHLI